jgi:hypothetical protein
MNLLRIAFLVHMVARRVDLEYASRPGKPMIVGGILTTPRRCE